MYSTCLFCHSSLGVNEVVEHFQVGRRLAFDAGRGRLWVVCQRCHNWNLSPVENRLEAVEECERTFRECRVRVSTENIGLATLREGLDLVRVGKPLLPEFAAWRYGSRLTSRRTRAASITAAASIAGGAALVATSVVTLAALAFVGVIAVPAVFVGAGAIEDKWIHDRVIARVRSPDGYRHSLKLRHIARLEILRANNKAGWKFLVAHDTGMLELEGTQATQMAGQILARVNRQGGTGSQVQDAARRIAALGDAERFIRHTSVLRETRRAKRAIFWNDDVGVLGLTHTERLALEIAVHEDAERMAMQGELAALEAAWRDAEEIAAISDGLLAPPMPYGTMGNA